MQNRTPRLPRQPAPNHAEPDARSTDALASALAAARRRALRDGDRQIDTAHLLHSLIETDPEVREAFGGGPRLAKVLGYLVQRSIGYGLRWQGSVEDSGAVPVVRAPAADGWSPSALAAMEGARDRAASRGATRAAGLDLLAALAADAESRAVEVLSRAGVEARGLAERVAALAAEASRPV
ncbi:Clp protease N-terminal domain-containing protein [Streptomyces sp. DH8]|uniref:Clp protease N-terminal domain-containing protein n=1 Tax=Streptomyces sp. DH8 TaxID=2857008 RepID=UPI001E4A4C16|nr:Clp protease N-terminal domain-containing protein [Streptomyces sp. DH8]